MMIGKSVNYESGFPDTKSILGMLSFVSFLSFLLISLNSTPANSEFLSTLNHDLVTSGKVKLNATFYKKDQQNNPVIAIENTYFDSDWDFKNNLYTLKEFHEHINSISAILYYVSVNSFNYPSYYGFSPLRSPPLA